MKRAEMTKQENRSVAGLRTGTAPLPVPASRQALGHCRQARHRQFGLRLRSRRRKDRVGRLLRRHIARPGAVRIPQLSNSSSSKWRLTRPTLIRTRLLQCRATRRLRCRLTATPDIHLTAPCRHLICGSHHLLPLQPPRLHVVESALHRRRRQMRRDAMAQDRRRVNRRRRSPCRRRGNPHRHSRTLTRTRIRLPRR